MEYANDGVIVVDTGSFKTLVGLAGDDKPKFEYRTVIAKNKHNDNLDLSKHDAEELWIPCYCNRTRYHDAKDVTPSSLFDNHDEFIYLMKDRRITSLDDSKKFWRHVTDKIHKYAQVENTNMMNNHMLFLDHVLTPKSTHVTVGEYTLEELNAESVCFVSQQICGLIASGRTSGTVVDVGYTTTTVCPIYDTAPLVHGITDIPVGGRTISEYFCNTLGITKKYTNHVDKKRSTEMRFEEEHSEKTFQLPDGQTIRYKTSSLDACSDILFDPSLMGINSIGITEAVDLGDPYNSLGIENIVVLIGAGSLVYGLQRKYLEKENKLKVVCPPERRYSAWIGGSIVGSISTYASNVVTKEQYDENGSSVWYRNVFKL